MFLIVSGAVSVSRRLLLRATASADPWSDEAVARDADAAPAEAAALFRDRDQRPAYLRRVRERVGAGYRAFEEKGAEEDARLCVDAEVRCVGAFGARRGRGLRRPVPRGAPLRRGGKNRRSRCSRRTETSRGSSPEAPRTRTGSGGASPRPARGRRRAEGGARERSARRTGARKNASRRFYEARCPRLFCEGARSTKELAPPGEGEGKGPRPGVRGLPLLRRAEAEIVRGREARRRVSPRGERVRRETTEGRGESRGGRGLRSSRRVPVAAAAAAS